MSCIAARIGERAGREIEAGGRFVSPPFIESHVHLDTLALLVIGCTLFRNVYPYPTEAARGYPIIAAVWSSSGSSLRSSGTPRRGGPAKG